MASHNPPRKSSIFLGVKPEMGEGVFMSMAVILFERYEIRLKKILVKIKFWLMSDIPCTITL